MADRSLRTLPNAPLAPTTLSALLVLPVLVVVSACGEPETTPVPLDVEEWQAELELRVGSPDDPEYALTDFGNLVVGESGRIYTLHRQEQLVRMLDSAGTLLGTIGGPGEGPGEFQRPVSMGWAADTLWVMDLTHRFTQFSGEGDVLDSFAVPFQLETELPGRDPPRAWGLLTDGRVHGSPPDWSDQIARGDITHVRPMLMSRDGSVTEVLPAIPIGNRSWAVFDPDDPTRGGSYGSQPFADGPLWSFARDARTMLRLDRDAPASADEGAFTLDRLTFEGDTVWTRTYPFPTSPVRREEADSVLDARARSLGERGFLGLTEARAREWASRTLYRPDFRSPIEEMVVGRDGTIWLRTSARPDPGSVLWLVLDASGEPWGRIVLPADVTVLEADTSRVWGRQSDDLDVPYLVRYRLLREGSSP